MAGLVPAIHVVLSVPRKTWMRGSGPPMTFTPPAPGNYNYDVNFNQAVDPASVQDSDLMVTGNSAPA